MMVLAVGLTTRVEGDNLVNSIRSVFVDVVVIMIVVQVSIF